MSKSSNGKKALVIKGYDHNGAFANSEELITALKNNGYNVLAVDAHKQAISLAEIREKIKLENFNDLDEVYILMHGKNPLVATDTSLLFNKFSLSPFAQEYALTASNLLEAIVEETGNLPIKVLLASCHGQLAFNQAHKILPTGSELITLSEDQVIEGKHYAIDGHGLQTVHNAVHLIEDFRELAQLSNRHFFMTPSPTYQKIGECNPRTSMNFTKNDLETLLSQVAREDVIEKVLTRLGDQEQNLHCISEEYSQGPMSLIDKNLRDHHFYSDKATDLGKSAQFYQNIYDSLELFSSLKPEFKQQMDQEVKTLIETTSTKDLKAIFDVELNNILMKIVKFFNPAVHMKFPSICHHHVEEFINFVQSSDSKYPLLDFRSKNPHGNVQNYLHLSIAESIYAIYDQCGEQKIIPDADFIPQESWISPESFELIPETMIYVAGKVFDYIGE